MSKAEVKTERVPPDKVPKVDSENCSCEKVEKCRKWKKKRKKRKCGNGENGGSKATCYACGKVEESKKVKDNEPKPGASCDDTPDSPENDVGLGRIPSRSSTGEDSSVKLEIDTGELDRERL